MALRLRREPMIPLALMFSPSVTTTIRIRSTGKTVGNRTGGGHCLAPPGADRCEKPGWDCSHCRRPISRCSIRTSVLTAILVTVMIACGQAAGSRSSPPSSGSASQSPVASNPSIQSPTSAASSSPSPSVAPSVTLLFHLTINGTVPSGDYFQLYFVDASQTLWGLCTLIPPPPCTGGGKVYTLNLSTQPGAVKPYEFQRVQHGDTSTPTITTFASGSIDTSHNAEVSAQYDY